MKSKTINLSLKSSSKILAIFAIFVSFTFAQSGKTVRNAEAAPTPTPTPETPTQKKSGADFVVDRNAEKYKLVFVPVEDGSLRSTNSRLDDFVAQLNREGEKGYKIVSSIDSRLALLRQDEIQYEYDWFKTKSSVHYSKSGLEENLKAATDKGFRVVYHNLLSSYCEPIDPENAALGENCQYLDLYLLAKEKGVRKKIEQVLINAFPGWGAQPSVELEEQIDKKLLEGFYPVNVFSPFEVLLEQTRYKDDLLSDKPDVQIIRSGWGRGDVMDKANDLGAQGYRLAMANNRIAVMYRNSETAQIPVSYLLLRADKKNFEKEIAKLQTMGAIYKMIYPTAKGTENTLIFELQLTKAVQPVEFKVLKFDFVSEENTAEKKVYTNLTPASKETIKTMNNLVNQGFEARGLFDTEKSSYKNQIRTYQIGVILERRK